MKLNESKINRWYLITQLPKLSLLKGMGFLPGEKIFVRFHQPFSGPTIVRLHHRYFAIGFALSEKISVQSLPKQGRNVEEK